MKKRFVYNIDVMGTCNLTCPSCPAGNSTDVDNPRGAMKIGLLRKVMEKAVSESEVEGVGLFNWTEPLLHYDIANMVETVQSFGVPCRLSSNLNILKHTDDLMRANPASLRVSASGFSQETYGLTHNGGNIEKVKRNMEILADAKHRLGASTRLEVSYHRYLGNLDDEVKFRKFATSLGYKFKPVWAFFMPLEKVLSLLAPSEINAKLTDEDHAIINQLALSPREASKVAIQYKHHPCVLQDAQMTLDFRGNVILCCAVFDSSKYGIGNYLDTPMTELQRRKYTHKMCGKCKKYGLHVYSTYGATELDKIALERLAKHYITEANIAMPTMVPPGMLTSTLIRMVPLRIIRVIQNILGR